MSTDEPIVPPSELARLILNAAKRLSRQVGRIEDPERAAEILSIIDGIVTAAQEIHGVAVHIAPVEDETAEEPVEFTGEWAQVTEGREYAFDLDAAPKGGAL